MPDDTRRDLDPVHEEAWRAHDRVSETIKEVNRATFTGANLTLRTFVLINGAAAVSVLAFIGGLIGQKQLSLDSGRDIASSLTWFAIGVAAAGLGMLFAYLTNYAIGAHNAKKMRTFSPPFLADTPASDRFRKLARWCHIIGMLLAAVSVILFIVGMFAVRDSIGRLKEEAGEQQTSRLVLLERWRVGRDSNP